MASIFGLAGNPPCPPENCRIAPWDRLRQVPPTLDYVVYNGTLKPVILTMFGFAAVLQRIRSLSFSIGQMTFGSFLTLLAVITATSMASVIAISHIDTTFAELQRLQDVGDLAAEIDRRMNELRLAARDFVTDPGARSGRVSEAASELNTLLKKTRLELAPEQQNMIDGVTQRLVNYREGIERGSELIARRADLLAGLSPVRMKFEAAMADVPDRASARVVFRMQNEVS